MTLPDKELQAARHAVEHLFGQCLLRLQAHELLMKAILAGHRLSAPITGLEAARADRAAETARKTMGMLVNDMLDSVLVPEGQDGLDDGEMDAPSISFGYQIGFPPEEFDRIEAEQRDLVLLRNTLVHHFLEQHDLRTVGGCLAAQQALTEALARATRAFEELRSWAQGMLETRKLLTDRLASADLQGFLVHGRVPWHISTIAQALHEAAVQLAGGDWASVDSAALWINEHYPEEQPEGYGCRSWRQVIRETGLFDLRRSMDDGRRGSWYRLRSQPG